MKNSGTPAAWDVDPAGKWVSKKEELNDGSQKVTIYRPHGRGTQASWWEARLVETSGYRNKNFEMATACFEEIEEPFTKVLARAQAAVASQTGGRY